MGGGASTGKNDAQGSSGETLEHGWHFIGRGGASGTSLGVGTRQFEKFATVQTQLLRDSIQRADAAQRILRSINEVMNIDVDGTDAQTIRSELSAAGLEKLTVDLLRRYPHNPDVLKEAIVSCGSLAYINSKRKTILIKFGAVEEIIAILKVNEENTAIEEEALWAIGNLAAGTNEEKQAMIDLGIAQVLVSALKRFPGSIIANKTALICAGNLANGSRERARVLMAAGIGDVTLIALNKHSIDHEVQAYACFCLSNIVEDELMHITELTAKGMIQSIAVSMSLHESTLLVQQYACKLVTMILRTGFAQDETCRVLTPLREHNLRSRIETALSNFNTPRGPVAKWAVLALEYDWEEACQGPGLAETRNSATPVDQKAAAEEKPAT